MKANGMTIGQRLTLGFAATLAIMLILTLIGIQRVGAIKDNLHEANEIHGIKLQHALDLRGSVHDRAIALRDVVLVNSAADAAALVADIERLAGDYTRSAQALEAMLTPANGTVQKEYELYEAVKAAQAKTLPLTRQVIDLRNAGDLEQARQLLLGQSAPAYVEWLDGINGFLEQQEKLQHFHSNAATTIASGFIWLMIGLCLVALLIGSILAVAITRQLLRELGAEPGEVRNLAAAVGRGELNVAPHASHHPDSIMASLIEMTRQLQDTVAHVRQTAVSVASGSSRISQHNEQMADRSEQSASALTETAAAMEQLGATVKQNADNARQADRLASSASQVASQGGELMHSVVDTMGAIHNRSKEIADIISLIDSIAFQTNILALNASVEAARAGEQGRGFAVVAGEVRQLAQRTAEAAKNITQLISETLQRVERGAALVDEAESTTLEIVAATARVSQIMTDISNASAEQSTGVEQATQAVTEMDQSTQHNRSLVEESASAAQHLRDQANQLVAAMAVFRLDGEAATQPTAAAARTPRAPQPAVLDSWS